MNEENLNTYYNKFYEANRLKTRHGQIEFITTIKYIDEYLTQYEKPSILDVGAGMGAYSEYLKDKGYQVKAVELVSHNAAEIKKKGIPTLVANATDLSKLKNEKYDLILLFGPLYHLITHEEKIKAINEAKKHLKENGIIMISYILNNYAIIRHGFMEQQILDEINNNHISNSFIHTPNKTDLYHYVTLEEIDCLNTECNMNRIKIIAQTGLSNYLRLNINKLSSQEFDLYLKYHLSICEDKSMLGTSSHVLDIIKSD